MAEMQSLTKTPETTKAPEVTKVLSSDGKNQGDAR